MRKIDREDYLLEKLEDVMYDLRLIQAELDEVSHNQGDRQPWPVSGAITGMLLVLENIYTHICKSKHKIKGA